MTDKAAAGATIRAACQQALVDPQASILVFVYKTADAQVLAKALAHELGQPVGHAHSQMPSSAKTAAIQAFNAGDRRVLVASSALAMGVNLPCTTVLVRDTHYPGIGPVPVHQLRQMCGRAGRGVSPGTAIVLVQDLDHRGPQALAKELADLYCSRGARITGSSARTRTKCPR